MATEELSVTKFREYLRINTMQPTPDYAGAVKFLQTYADELGLPTKVYELFPGKPIFIMTWEGKDPSLPTLILNSHIDVVPVFPGNALASTEYFSVIGICGSDAFQFHSPHRILLQESWKVDPFSAHKYENGDIYARGSQDMKCVGIQYLEAVRRLKKEGVSLLRTVHLSFVPDEEIGGLTGMKSFVKEKSFEKLNVGYALDEGLANPTDSFTVFYGERCIYQFKVRCPGNPGHGSRFVENTAGEKLRIVLDRFMDFRAKEEQRMKSDPSFRLGDVTTVNLTSVEGGVQANVIPNELCAGFDVRISPKTTTEEMEKLFQQWCKEAGDGVTIDFSHKDVMNPLTSIDESDPWWNAFSSTLKEMNLKYETEIFPAGTDGRYMRDVGKPVIGFSPMNNTPILLHDHNEFLNEKIFLKGIDVYYKLIPALANVKI